MNAYKVKASEIKHDGGDQPGLMTVEKVYVVTASTALTAEEVVRKLHPDATVTHELLVQNV